MSAYNLETKLWNTVPKLLKFKILENHISKTTVCWNRSHSFNSLNFWIWDLCFRAAVDPHIQIGWVDFASIRPNTTHTGDWPFRKTNSQADRITVLRGTLPSAGLSAPAGRRRLQKT